MNPKTFLKEFKTIANAPGGIQRLREMILQLAVQGKLVEQNPKDESASELFKKIEAEFKNERRGKKNLITQDEEYFYLPTNWLWVRLKWIGKIFNGNSINERVKKEKYLGKKEGLPFIATKDVGYGFSSLTYDNGVKIPFKEPKFKIAHSGAVLICAEGGSAGKKCGITDRDICFGNKLFALECPKEVLGKYILGLYLTPIFFAQFQKKMTGIIGGVSLANFSEIPIPLPPLEEQHRIVAKVDQLMVLCDKLEAEQNKRSALIRNTRKFALDALANASGGKELQVAWKRVEENLGMLFEEPKDVEELKKCILQNAVMGKLVEQNPKDEPASELLKKIQAEKQELIKKGEIKKEKPLPPIRDDEKPFKIPKGWEWCRLGDLADISSGATPLKSRIDYYQNGSIPWVTSTLTGYDKIERTEIFISKIAIKECRLKIYKPGTLIMAMYGQGKTRGQVSELMIDAAVNQACAAISFLNKAAQTKAYVQKVLNKQYDEIRDLAEGGAQPNLNGIKVRNTIIPFPPLEEQRRIVAKIQSLLTLCDTLQKQLSSALKIAGQLAQTVVESITGISTEKHEKMKTPKTELVTKLKLAKKPGNKEHAPLSSILIKHNDELSAKALWNNSGLSIDEFYKQLKTEMLNGWIEEPVKAEMRLMAEPAGSKE